MERPDRNSGICGVLCSVEFIMNPKPELTLQELEQALRVLPEHISKAGEELIAAENKLAMAQAQRDIGMARERIKHIGEELSAKEKESLAILAVEAETKEVIGLEQAVEVKKLAKELLENKYVSARKIATLKNIYQPL